MPSLPHSLPAIPIGERKSGLPFFRNLNKGSKPTELRIPGQTRNDRYMVLQNVMFGAIIAL
ncbi:MAG: hypothetical protein AMJ79_05955 [Phycisphaerae bacterium SM23_30]|nr:MAG: hypothetical protein AMJ79_05955 [Phycisphaerae bacterium SM23_30]